MLKFWDPRALEFYNFWALGAPKWGALFSHDTGALGKVYQNEVSNSCAIQKELNRLFGQVNSVPVSWGI